MMSAHLSDDRLVELYFTETPSAQEQQHLGSCAECDARRSGMAHLLDETALAAEEDLEAAFPADRLARQQLRILERAEAISGPARVIAFPAAPPASPGVVSRTRSTTRWIAAAAVAGLIVGVVAGRAGREGPTGMVAGPAMSQPLAQSQGPGIRTVSATLSDDEFLLELESAIESRNAGALRALDELTPRAGDR
jgi:hypothetical protein